MAMAGYFDQSRGTNYAVIIKPSLSAKKKTGGTKKTKKRSKHNKKKSRKLHR
jgi:hypothetical protein